MSERPEQGAAGSGGLDEALQREIDEALGGMSLEDILEEETGRLVARKAPSGPVEPGQVCTATVVAVDPQGVLVEMGGKDQGVVALDQFEVEPAVGDRIELEVMRYDRSEDLWVLSRQGAVEHATWENLEEGQIVEAFVEAANKGGLEVSFGGVKAFMPISQISMYRVEATDEFLKTKLRCQVTEVDRRERRVIVSARALMELEAQEKREKLLAELKEGDVREGVVRQIMPFGVFVDLGGADGLVHVSQMSYGRVEDPATVVQPGQTVTVQVLSIDKDANRIALGMKQVLADPWETVEDKYPPGHLATGQIVSIRDFGAFCRLEEGVEALVPISEITWMQRLKHPSEMLAVGQTVQAVVLEVDSERRRMSLSIKQAQASPWSGAETHFPATSEQLGKVTRIADFGAFVEIAPGVEGLLHISELSDDRVRRVEDVVQVGQTVRARVLDVDEHARRISLTLKGVSQADEPAAPEAGGEPDKSAKKRKRPLRGGLD